MNIISWLPPFITTILNMALLQFSPWCPKCSFSTVERFLHFPTLHEKTKHPKSFCFYLAGETKNFHHFVSKCVNPRFLKEKILVCLAQSRENIQVSAILKNRMLYGIYEYHQSRSLVSVGTVIQGMLIYPVFEFCTQLPMCGIGVSPIPPSKLRAVH